MKVIKRNGSTEDLNYSKIEEVINIAVDNLDDVSLSDILVHAKLNFYDNIKTSDIHKTIINSAADLISVEQPNYELVAGRLLYFEMSKCMFKKDFIDIIHGNVADSFYSQDLLSYSDDEIKDLGLHLKNKFDNKNIKYGSLKQLQTKYLIKNRELPEHMYMAMAMAICIKDRNISVVKDIFNSLAHKNISLASPLLVSCRTPQKQLSSCALLETGDSLDSIGKTTDLILKYVSQKAGFGISIGNIRALGSDVRKGDVTHTGIIPFIKLLASAVKSCSQGGFRGGSATLFYPYWHLEIEDLLVLKNNRGTEENRVRNVDYCVQLDNYFYDAVINDKLLYLFSPHEVPDLKKVFYADTTAEKIQEVIEKYISDGVKSKTIKARELFNIIIQQRAETGRLYIQNIHHCNANTSFNETNPVKMSNLCMEICLPTAPCGSILNGEMALCTLGAVNLAEIEEDNMHYALPHICNTLIIVLNQVLDYQNYLCQETINSSSKIRSLGIGVTNFAYFLAKHKLKYGDDKAKELTRKLFEHIQYYCVKASIQYAKNNPSTKVNKEFNYLKKINYIKNNSKIELDWDYLAAEYKKYGISNTTLTAIMPCESSSLVLSSTNGIEPIRSLQITKESKAGVIRMLVPESDKLGKYYTQCWDIDNKDYLSLVGIMQVFVDQAISSNTYYKSSDYEDGKVPAHNIAKDIILTNKLGIKTLYYHNTHDGSENVDDSCESCKL